LTGITERKRSAFNWVNENRARFSDLQMRIWNYAETAWREYKSAAAFCEVLRAEGFDVEEGSGEMPTAFMATYGKGKPVLATFAEYDAVPAQSQQGVPYRAPREGLHPYAAGHTDTHSMLGVAALVGALATQKAMQKHGLKGTVKIFGEPAEKVCGSKPVHAAKGYFDDMDAAVVYHPNANNTVVWDTHFGAYWSVVFTFECQAPEKWIDKSLMPLGGHSHASARCPGAVDALCLMYTMTKYTKEAMFPHTGTWTLNETILSDGQATSDNLPPRFSQIQYAWRSPALGIQEQIYRVLENNARQAAATTGCVAHVRWVTKTRVGLPNHAISDLTYRNLELVGAPSYSEEAKEFGRQIQRNLGVEPMDNPLLEVHSKLTPMLEYENMMRQAFPPWQKHFAADDYVDYTWHAPTARLYTARPRLRPPAPAFEYPGWTTNALGGRPELIDPGMFVAGKTIAGSFVDLLTDPAELEKAQAEFKERTGGGVGGSKWVGPLLPKDFYPPVDLRWPEYVTTVRGEEWWIPTPHPRGGMGTKL
jgi:aminobenzoyl-glutamate utilization protein B